ncbi:dihydrouridine synthase domain-containing protein [Cyclospora cayetanensis]|uniref:Dihydrouridine synthase domain-containing protein n=1 Tax=Cyclospora cayetanensis TaxID=88456 RepID=A0A1D3D2R5_9EIME|nr:dihydrouridine synthase domain-containing protein [Cyclospora cayetanensis]
MLSGALTPELIPFPAPSRQEQEQRRRNVAEAEGTWLSAEGEKGVEAHAIKIFLEAVRKHRRVQRAEAGRRPGGPTRRHRESNVMQERDGPAEVDFFPEDARNERRGRGDKHRQGESQSGRDRCDCGGSSSSKLCDVCGRAIERPRNGYEEAHPNDALDPQEQWPIEAAFLLQEETPGKAFDPRAARPRCKVCKADAWMQWDGRYADFCSYSCRDKYAVGKGLRQGSARPLREGGPTRRSREPRGPHELLGQRGAQLQQEKQEQWERQFSPRNRHLPKKTAQFQEEDPQQQQKDKAKEAAAAGAAGAFAEAAAAKKVAKALRDKVPRKLPKGGSVGPHTKEAGQASAEAAVVRTQSKNRRGGSTEEEEEPPLLKQRTVARFVEDSESAAEAQNALKEYQDNMKRLQQQHTGQHAAPVVAGECGLQQQPEGPGRQDTLLQQEREKKQEEEVRAFREQMELQRAHLEERQHADAGPGEASLVEQAFQDSQLRPLLVQGLLRHLKDQDNQKQEQEEVLLPSTWEQRELALRDAACAAAARATENPFSGVYDGHLEAAVLRANLLLPDAGAKQQPRLQFGTKLQVVLRCATGPSEWEERETALSADGIWKETFRFRRSPLMGALCTNAFCSNLVGPFSDLYTEEEFRVWGLCSTCQQRIFTTPLPQATHGSSLPRRRVRLESPLARCEADLGEMDVIEALAKTAASQHPHPFGELRLDGSAPVAFPTPNCLWPSALQLLHAQRFSLVSIQERLRCCSNSSELLALLQCPLLQRFERPDWPSRASSAVRTCLLLLLQQHPKLQLLLSTLDGCALPRAPSAVGCTRHLPLMQLQTIGIPVSFALHFNALLAATYNDSNGMEDEGSSLDGSQPLLAVAPMIAVSNSHFRNFMRLLTRKTTLYTEMVVDSTILHNTHHLDDHIGFDEYEHPVVCQLGGSNADTVSEAATWVERTGYDEVNLNVGCPSCRVVSKGCFGAALMRTPEKVRDIVYQMKRRVQIPVTVKCRLGVDTLDSPEFTRNFVEGVDPKKNRSVPPLLYDRAAMNDPCCLAQADTLIYGTNRNPDSANCRRSLMLAYLDYLERYEQSARKPKNTKIRCSTPNEPAVEALLQAMDAVDNEFPGVLDYPINLGKNPHYSEISGCSKGD